MVKTGKTGKMGKRRCYERSHPVTYNTYLLVCTHDRHPGSVWVAARPRNDVVYKSCAYLTAGYMDIST